MWPFSERRRNKRYAVDWEAEVHCAPLGQTEYLRTQVIEVSRHGARIRLFRMHLRTYHLMVNNNPDELELVIHLPEGTVRSNIIIRWYNRLEGEQLFTVGVEFCDMREGIPNLLEEESKTSSDQKG